MHCWYRAPPTFMRDASTGSKKTSVTPQSPSAAHVPLVAAPRGIAGLVSHATRAASAVDATLDAYAAGAVLDVYGMGPLTKALP